MVVIVKYAGFGNCSDSGVKKNGSVAWSLFSLCLRAKVGHQGLARAEISPRVGQMAHGTENLGRDSEQIRGSRVSKNMPVV